MSEDNKLYCKICEKTFSNVSALNKHLKTASHLQNELNKEQNKNIEKVEAGKGKIKVESYLYCPICDYSSDRIGNFTNHTLSNIHQQNEQLLLDRIKTLNDDESQKKTETFIDDISRLNFKIGLVKINKKYEDVTKQNIINDFIYNLNLDSDQNTNLENFFDDTLKKREYPEHIEKSEKDKEKIEKELNNNIERINKYINHEKIQIKKIEGKIKQYEESITNYEKHIQKINKAKETYDQFIEILQKRSLKGIEPTNEEEQKSEKLYDILMKLKGHMPEIALNPYNQINKKKEIIKKLQIDLKENELKLKNLINPSEKVKKEIDELQEQKKEIIKEEKKKEKEKIKQDKKDSKIIVRKSKRELKVTLNSDFGMAKERKEKEKREKEMRENEEEED